MGRRLPYVKGIGPPNNAGKSSILHAINILYNSTGKQVLIDPNDFFVHHGKDDLEIRYTFDSLTKRASEDLGHYARGGVLKFIVRASKDENGSVSAVCRGIRLGNPEFATFFEAANAGAKKKVYEELQSKGYDLPSWSSQQVAAEALHESESADESRLSEIESTESAYGATGPASKLSQHLDWTFVPAVKEIADEAYETKNSAFSKLIIRAVRGRINVDDRVGELRSQTEASIAKILADSTGALEDVGKELNKQFRQLTSSNIDVGLDWGDPQSVLNIGDPSVQSILKEGDLRDGPDRFGHGLQRTYLMALLAVVARFGEESENSPKMLLGIEEPELYQHPPQAKFLSTALHEIAEAGSQVITTTHSPYFANARRFDQIRTVRKSGAKSAVSFWTVGEHRQYYAERAGADPIGEGAALSALDRLLQPQKSEVFFCGKAVLCEGLEDIAILTTFMAKKGKYLEFLKNGCHFISSDGKGSMPSLITLCRGFNIPCHFIFDLDFNLEEQDRQNDTILNFIGDLGEQIDEATSDDQSTPDFTCWNENIQGSIAKDVGDWLGRCRAIAEDWGWNYKRMNKDPMLLERAISEVVDEGIQIPCLDQCMGNLEEFWTK